MWAHTWMPKQNTVSFLAHHVLNGALWVFFGFFFHFHYIHLYQPKWLRITLPCRMMTIAYTNYNCQPLFLLYSKHPLVVRRVHMPRVESVVLALNRTSSPQAGHIFMNRISIECAWWRHQMETFSALLVICAGKFTGPRWIPHTKASDAELWCFLWSESE